MGAHDCPDCLGTCYCTASGPGDPPEDCRHLCPLSGYNDGELEAMAALQPITCQVDQLTKDDLAPLFT